MTGESNSGHLFTGNNENLVVVQSTKLKTSAVLFRIKKKSVRHISKKWLIFKMHKDFQQQKINYKADLKAAKDSNRHFFIKVQVANS